MQKLGTDDVLEGTFNFDQTNDIYMKQLIYYLRKLSIVKRMRSILTVITKEEHIIEWLNQNESMASSNNTLSYKDHKTASYNNKF